jgi:hypothetical protein
VSGVCVLVRVSARELGVGECAEWMGWNRMKGKGEGRVSGGWCCVLVHVLVGVERLNSGRFKKLSVYGLKSQFLGRRVRVSL